MFSKSSISGLVCDGEAAATMQQDGDKAIQDANEELEDYLDDDDLNFYCQEFGAGSDVFDHSDDANLFGTFGNDSILEKTCTNDAKDDFSNFSFMDVPCIMDASKCDESQPRNKDSYLAHVLDSEDWAQNMDTLEAEEFDFDCNILPVVPMVKTEGEDCYSHTEGDAISDSLTDMSAANLLLSAPSHASGDLESAASDVTGDPNAQCQVPCCMVQMYFPPCPQHPQGYMMMMAMPAASMNAGSTPQLPAMPMVPQYQHHQYPTMSMVRRMNTMRPHTKSTLPAMMPITKPMPKKALQTKTSHVQESVPLCVPVARSSQPALAVPFQLHNAMKGAEEKRCARQESLARFRIKKARRLSATKVRYHLRKINADNRPRIKGRFVKKQDIAKVFDIAV